MKKNLYVLTTILSLVSLMNINSSATILHDVNSDNSINILDVLSVKHDVLNNNGNIADYTSSKRVALGMDNPTYIDENLGKYVLISNLNFRECADINSNSYGIISKNTLINVIETSISNDGILWGKYELNGIIGWSSLKYATKNNFDIYQGNGLTFIDDLLIVNKTYSLPSSYAPMNDTITSQTDDAFKLMQSDASKLGLNIYISSGYRSYTYQQGLYERYAKRDGYDKADTYSARAGHSEHQTGLCFDLNSISDSFAYTKEGIWIAENCYKYGFIIRYPKDKDSITGYKYESWHLRYVGVDLATELHNTNLTIEEYLGITSEYS